MMERQERIRKEEGCEAVSLLEEEVWRKGLGEDREGSGFHPTTLFLPVLPYFSPFKYCSHTRKARTHTHTYTPPPGCQGLPEKALTDLMIQPVHILPLSFSCTDSEETDHANIPLN